MTFRTATPSRTDWLTAPSTDFTRDVRGSAWIDSLIERTVRGRAKRVRAARISSYAHQVISSYATDLREHRFMLLGLCRFSRTELDVLASFDPDDPKAGEPLDLAINVAKADAGLWYLADRGSCVHKILEHDDRGAQLPQELVDEAAGYGINEMLLARLRGNWRALLKRWGLRVVAIEQTVVADDFGAAGTLDRLVELQRPIEIAGRTIPMGAIVVLDIKTSALWLANGVPAYWGPYTCQIALYAIGTPYLVGADKEPDRRVRWPFDVEIDSTNGLVGHVNLNPLDGPLGACTIWHADLDAGLELAVLARAARRFEARRDLFQRAP
jgi:hypothetical protein